MHGIKERGNEMLSVIRIKIRRIKERIKTEFCTHTWKQSQFQMLTDDATTSYICTKCGKHSQF